MGRCVGSPKAEAVFTFFVAIPDDYNTGFTSDIHKTNIVRKMILVFTSYPDLRFWQC